MSESLSRRELLRISGGAVAAAALPQEAKAQNAAVRNQAAQVLRKGVEFFRTKVGVQGTYLWRYSEDLSRREGEGKATSTQAWVQPPGTPTVGEALLTAYEGTQDQYYLDAAKETAQGLIQGQLQSGGWDYRIEVDPRYRGQFAYRDRGNARGKNVTTFDDDTTQSALRFLMRIDTVLRQSDDRIHRAVEYAFASLLKAQYTNGAWPQRYDRFPDPVVVKKAAYPESWPRTYPAVDYKEYFTFNDRNVDRLIETFLLAWHTYGKPEYMAAVEKAGDFILLAQMPDPQPAWAQQYDREMQPAWARKFEPPAVTGGESQTLLRTLMTLFRETGKPKYLEPIPRALEYLRKSRLPDGRLARFYELKTNKPLYFTKTYELTYSDADLPTHYGFKVPDSTESVARMYERVKDTKPIPQRRVPKSPVAGARADAALEARVKAVVAAQDEQGRWVEEGRLKYHGADDPTRRIIDTATFVRNVEVLSQYLAGSAK